MKLLEERIIKDGVVAPGGILKVSNFLNHQMDVGFICELGKEIYRLFSDCGVNKILTIESSGIGIACLSAQYFEVPVVYAKKSASSNISSEVWSAGSHSFTHGNDYSAIVDKRFLSKNDTVLIIDDFLASGAALEALISICEQACVNIVGCVAIIEKVCQGGGNHLRSKGYRVESLAKIESMSVEDGVKFCD